MKFPRWIPPFVLAAILGWWVSRPSGPTFVRLPGSGYPAPAWKMPDLEGRERTSAEFAGRTVVLNFWATWCPPCLRELPELNAFSLAQATNGVVVIGAAVDEGGAKAVAPLVRREGLAYPIFLADTNVQMTFGISTLPTTLIIAPDGRVAARYLGSLTHVELGRAIAPLLKPASPSVPSPP
ncbi:MAG: TlpA family protein disulfide reductase [Verrucomicrobiales bacterium]|nr:TlpA family protein disulfide reductase [Verrucomicrobiales bacterium]